MEKIFTFSLNEEGLQALFQGKRVEMVKYHGIHDGQEGVERLVILPPHYGVFMTYEKYAELERACQYKAFEQVLDMLDKLKKDDTFKQN